MTSSTQTVPGGNQSCSPSPMHPATTGIPSANLGVEQEQVLSTSGSGISSSGNVKRSSSNSSTANLANLPPIERPKVKASRKIPGKESLSPSSKDSNLLGTASANTSPSGPAATSAGTSQQQQTGQTTSSTPNAAGSPSVQAGFQQQHAKKSDSQLQAARHQHSQQLAQLQQLQQLNQQLQEQVLYQRQQKQQNQATLAALQQNAIANQQQLAALQQNVAQLQQLEQHILQQQQTTHTTGNDSTVPPSPGCTQSSSSSGTSTSNLPSSASSATPPQQPTLSSVNISSNSSAANQQHQQLQGKIQQIVQQKQQLQAQIKQFQQQVEQQLAYTQNATPGSAGPATREGLPITVSSETVPSNPGSGVRTSNKRSKEAVDHPLNASKDLSATTQGSKDSSASSRQAGAYKSNRSKNQTNNQPSSSAQSSSGDNLPSSSVANAAYELVQASQALQAVQALQQQHLDTTSTSSSSNQSSPSPTVPGGTGGDVEPLTQDPALLSSLDPAHLAAAVQNCPLPLDANCQAILNGYKEGMQAGQVLATTLQVN